MNLFKQKYPVRDKQSGEMTTRESDNWYYRFNRYAKTHTGSTGSSNKKTAQQFVLNKMREIDDERKAMRERGDKKLITIVKAFEIYLDSTAGATQHHNITTRLNKMLGQKLSPAKEIVPLFGFDGHRSFETLTDADVQQLVLHRRKEGTSDGTILAELSALSQTIKLIKKLGYMVPEIDFADIKKDSKVRTSSGKLRFLTADEEELFLYHLHPDTVARGTGSEAVYKARQDAYDLAVLLLDFGGRYGELAQMTWKQVDMAKGVVHLYRSKVDNESTLYMTRRSKEVLKRRRAAAPTSQFVFEAKDGTARKYTPGAFQSAIKRAGLEGVTIHTMRHTFSSEFLQNGGSLPELQQLLGHASATTSARYGHLVPNQASARAAEIMNRRHQS